MPLWIECKNAHNNSSPFGGSKNLGLTKEIVEEGTEDICIGTEHWQIVDAVTDAIIQTKTKHCICINLCTGCVHWYCCFFRFLFHLVHILISVDLYGKNNYMYKRWYRVHISYNIWFSDHFICVRHYVVVVVRHRSNKFLKKYCILFQVYVFSGWVLYTNHRSSPLLNKKKKIGIFVDHKKPFSITTDRLHRRDKQS